MLNLERLQGPVSGLVSALDEMPPSEATADVLEPQRAITTLLDQHENNILAYLKFARSQAQFVRDFPGHGSLSRDQVLAVEALKDFADDTIRTWLEQAQKLCEILRCLELQELTSTST